jgi:TrmH family RNA methyltransferase
VTAPDLATIFRSARTDDGFAVLEGFHAVKHAIRFGAEITSAATRDPAALDALAKRLAPDVASALTHLATPVAPELFDQLSPTPPDTGVIAIARRRIATVDDVVVAGSTAPVILLDSPAHSGNIGAAIRVAAGAGAAAVITTGTNDPWNPGALRGSAGLHYALPVMRIESLDSFTYPLIIVDAEGDDIGIGTIPDQAVLAFGSERSGLSPALRDRATASVRIPMKPGVSSLNLATAVAVVLYAWRLGK